MNGGTDSLRPFARGFLICLAAVLLSVATASAKPRICRQLEAELAAVSSGGGSSARARSYDRAIVSQRKELAKMRSRVQAANCGVTLFDIGECRTLNTTIRRMERNLGELERERAGMRTGPSRREQSRILASLETNGCRDAEIVERKLPQPIEVEDRNADLLRRVFGEISQEEPFPDELDGDGERNVQQVLNPIVGLRFEGMDRTYRTACVRTCDGYMFPMSNQSARLDFDRDQKNCESTCPGSEVQLFYGDAGESGSYDMVSAAGDVPYEQLPNANLYKDVSAPRPAMCGCTAQPKNFSVIAGKSRQDNLPSGREPVEQSGTLATADEALTSPPLAQLPPPPPSGERKVRVVGPVFLPDQSEAIDLRAPARP